MSNTKHTPGPWQWSANSPHKYGDGKWLSAKSGMVLDYGGCGSHKCEVTEADARLIAAAPDLLAALQVMIRDYAAVHDIGDVEMQPAIYQARTAIAKATEGN